MEVQWGHAVTHPRPLKGGSWKMWLAPVGHREPTVWSTALINRCCLGLCSAEPQPLLCTEREKQRKTETC